MRIKWFLIGAVCASAVWLLVMSGLGKKWIGMLLGAG
jgi:arginine exporter protein ArgO